MVTKLQPDAGRPSRARRKGGSALHKKLLRDFARAKLQFLSMMLLCALGSWVFSGLDAAWRMLDLSVESFFEEQNLADYWVQLPGASREDLRRIGHIDGVEDAQLRIKIELDTDFDNDSSLLVYGYDELPRVNVPLVEKGEALTGQDRRGLMLDEAFAQANGIAVGDRLTLSNDEAGFTQSFIVRALVSSPEQISTTKDISADPEHYGFAIVLGEALAPLPASEIILSLAPGAHAQFVSDRIEALYPYAMVLSQRSHTSTQRVRDDVNMFRNLSYVFPLLAFAVAAMIVLTTLTRMIENQRVQMGTLEALGYSPRKIRNHYLRYALYPSLAGSLIGLYVGRLTLPDLLWNLEESIYTMPQKRPAPISLPAWFVCALGVLLALSVCYIVYRKAANESAAALLRPKPPKAGSRNLLERIPRLWQRFDFNTKMVARNMFRNKLRTVMTLIGILCCNMLLITTLGLQDSVKYFVGSYYNGTLNYTLRVDLKSDAGTLESYRKRLDAQRVDGMMVKAVSLRTDEIARTSTLTVLCDDQQSFRLGDHYTYTELPQDGIALTEKMMKTLGVSVGDTLTVYLAGDDEPLYLPITKMLYSTIGQGAYASQSYWESLRRGDFIPSALLLKEPTPECVNLVTYMDETSELKDPDVQYEQNLGILNSLTTIFTVMAGAALGLAFVITYNMGILNFVERTREYATLKVLGYHQKEIKRLMVRESNLVGLLGTLLGVIPGILLIGVIMKSCESEQMLYGTYVTVQSLCIASVITFGFSRFLQIFLTRNVRKIDMVESLKSVE